MKIELDLSVITEGQPKQLKEIIERLIRDGIENSSCQGDYGVDVSVNSVKVIE